ncbi:MAG: heavy metal translocating P-type ATPase [Planctomycetaceae bacterium]
MYELPVLNSPSHAPEQPPLATGPSVRFLVEGMHCASCVSRVESGLKSVPGVVDARVNLATREATVVLADQTISPPWGPVLESLGYRYVVSDDSTSGSTRSASSPVTWLICAAISAIVMLLCMTSIRFPGWQLVLLAGSAAVVFGFGRGFFTGAWARLRHGSSDMDTLIALGSGIAFLAGLGDMWKAGHHHHASMHFDAAVMIVTFVLLGRWLEERARGQASTAIDELIQLAPNDAVLLRNGQELTVPLTEVHRGDTVLLRPGSRVPVDGTILTGQADFEESMLTGESLPVPKGVGASVSAGTLCHGGSVTISADRVGDATTLQKIVGLVRDAQGTKAPIAKLADRVAAIFVPVILGIAAITAIAWLWFAPADRRIELAINAAVSVLVIACPCALGLATPTAVMVAMGQAAKHGLLIRDGAVLESLGQLDIMAFDKTGTLTRGQPRVSALTTHGSLSQKESLGVAAALAKLSEHPLSRAIVEFAERQKAVPVPLPVEDFRSLSGRGLSARIGGHHIELSREEPGTRSSKSSTSSTRTMLLVDGVSQAAFEFQDELRPTAASAVQRLHQLGIHSILLTGDRDEVAQIVAKQVGIDRVAAHLLPDQKLGILRETQQSGARVGMVGDGINDAPALAQADIGFALGTGTDIAISAADVTVMHGDLLGVARAVELSRTTMKTIRQNLVFAFGYNLIGVPLAAGVLYPWTGWMLPLLFAAGAMSLSSVSVVLNSLRLKLWKPE